MSKASVAQEPSMDEILASIRKIIETGDERSSNGVVARSSVAAGARKPPSFLSPLPERHVSDVATGSDGASDAAGGTDRALEPEWPNVFRADAVSPSSTPVVSSSHAGHPSVEDALTAELETELAATWERIELPHGSANGRSIDTLEEQDTGLPAASFQSMSTTPEAERYADRNEETPVANPAEHDGFGVASSVDPLDAPPARETDMDRNPFEPANSDARFEPVSTESVSRFGDVPPPLASPATGQLVGASFNELAEAIRKGELRSLEAMAQEMLQPMLRDWLDDNLPQMVERLVREEIERMSRGGKR